MADGYKLWVDCCYCNKGKRVRRDGDGNLVDVACEYCNGSGYMFFGWCSVDTFTLPTNLPNAE